MRLTDLSIKIDRRPDEPNNAQYIVCLLYFQQYLPTHTLQYPKAIVLSLLKFELGIIGIDYC